MLRFEVGASVDQFFHHLKIPGPGGVVERSAPEGIPLARRRACLQQCPHALDIAGADGCMQLGRGRISCARAGQHMKSQYQDRETKRYWMGETCCSHRKLSPR